MENSNLRELLYVCAYVFIGSLLSGLYLTDEDRDDGSNKREAIAVFLWPLVALWRLMSLVCSIFLGVFDGIRDYCAGR